MVTYLTTTEAAQVLGAHRSTVIGMCERGEIAGALKTGNRWRIPADALQPDTLHLGTLAEQLAHQLAPIIAAEVGKQLKAFFRQLGAER